MFICIWGPWICSHSPPFSCVRDIVLAGTLSPVIAPHAAAAPVNRGCVGTRGPAAGGGRCRGGGSHHTNAINDHLRRPPSLPPRRPRRRYPSLRPLARTSNRSVRRPDGKWVPNHSCVEIHESEIDEIRQKATRIEFSDQLLTGLNSPSRTGCWS